MKRAGLQEGGVPLLLVRTALSLLRAAAALVLLAPILLLVWFYYSGQVFFFGAELTKVYARRYGSHRFAPAVATVRAA